ncbi:MAG: Nif3-like dinuclear metal center hexameric protein [Chthoniobacteraceae bacterium]
MKTLLHDLVTEMDSLLRIAEIVDYPTAVNGLQIENSGKVTRIGAAVDGCEWTMAEAARRGVDLLLVHHGLLWGGLAPVTGIFRRKVKLAFDADLAVYSAHLPLDLHPTLGNNALLAKALGFKKTEPAFEEKGSKIGLVATALVDRAALVKKLETTVEGPVKLIAGGPEKCRRIGLVTGGAGSLVTAAALREKVDTFITGEGSNATFTAAEELGVNLLYAGHYATETFGVKALAAQVAKKFRLPWEFIDHPTGM